MAYEIPPHEPGTTGESGGCFAGPSWQRRIVTPPRMIHRQYPVEHGSAPVACPVTLHDVLTLNEMQIKRLEEVDFAREDDLFPLLQDQREKQWELRRHRRGSDPNEAMDMMPVEDLKRIQGEIGKVNAKHRSAAMALLSASQKLALRRLAEAFELQFAAWDAIRFNLIETAGDATFGLHGFGQSDPEVAGLRLSISEADRATHDPAQDRQRLQDSAHRIPGMQPLWRGLPQNVGR